MSRAPDSGRVFAGGKGANQAVAAARLSGGTGRKVQFVCQFGNDAHAPMLRKTLVDHGVDISGSGHCKDKPSGQGYVFLEPDGTASSVVVGGSNASWPSEIPADLSRLVGGASAVLLQREIPEHVNEYVAQAASSARVPILQDAGGEDRPISDALLGMADFVAPNETELARLTGLPVASEAEAVAAAERLQARGARAVLVTLGEGGALLLTGQGLLLRQPCLRVPGGRVVDATGAGDSFRAAFATGLVEGRPLEECLRLAAAAGALAVSRLGAIPSLPTREECEQLAFGTPSFAVGGSSASSSAPAPAPAAPAPAAPAPAARDREEGRGDGFPLKFASRLNSMKDRLDLWGGANDVLGWVARQGTIRGLGLVDFNYPQHLSGLAPEQARGALRASGLEAGAVCLRYPKEFILGALTNPDAALRQRAIDITLEAGAWARELGARELIVWSAFDGYDYSMQVDHTALWSRIVDAFQKVCSAYPDLLVSLEFKPTDENMRFFAVPSTGAAMLLVRDIDCPNMGLTLDFGHCLAAGENPAQSAAMVGSAGKLFGIQLNDGYQRIGAEDGLMFGSVHPLMALEFVMWLQKTDYKGHVYFDTFPNEDPVREAEYNIRRFKALWRRAERLQQHLGGRLAAHDALGVLEAMEELGDEC
ncbi:unnamed protein product [Prorocentrum cordatum]|uniref:Ribokinase n=1 Tax=Prorocentrum cordatum TaxID=2364126 RepID=A0ABN9WVL6_9DINO|nr:unnamed protein product [Polarella glacialis]